MTLRDLLYKHAGHRVEIAVYGDWDNPQDVCLEDLDTNEVILDAELYDFMTALIAHHYSSIVSETEDQDE